MKTFFYSTIVVTLIAIIFTSCNKESKSKMIPNAMLVNNTKIGKDTNSTAVVGKFIHLGMDIKAEDVIETISVEIHPKLGENYSHDWACKWKLNEYNGFKNINLQEQFELSKEAAIGTYDVLISVKQKNGIGWNKIETIKIVDPGHLDVDPKIDHLMIQKIGKKYFHVMNQHAKFMNVNDTIFRSNDKINTILQISGVKDDGIIYSLLIKKNLNNRPETVDDIDFSKVIVCGLWKHDFKEVTTLANYYPALGEITPNRPDLRIGAKNDNNIPISNPIEGDKKWESGRYYYYGVIYNNETHNINLHYYVEFDIII